METVRFIHAADLHLDAAFRGLAQDVSPELATRLHEATFTALERLVALCEKERPDMLILAGDVYNQEDRSVRAQLRLRDGCVRLERAGVRVFIVHGNHDPYPSRLAHLNWPANVTIFGEDVESHAVLRDGRLIAMVHGASHASARETRNLAARFVRGPEPCLHIGVLHTTLGEADGEARYAPCSLDDLSASGMDYWALGHVHERTVLCESPMAVYPGALQGLHINEPGDKGCLLVSATAPTAGQDNGRDWRFALVPRPLAPLRWETLEISLDVPLGTAGAASTTGDAGEADGARPSAGALTLDEADLLLRRSLDSLASRLEPHIENVVVRLRLTGRTPLDALLRSTQAQSDLLDTLREVTFAGPLLWIKDMQVLTRPEVDHEALLGRDDLLGEVARLTEGCRNEPAVLEESLTAALGNLYDHVRARKALVPLSEAEQRELLDSAESLCVDLLENA